MSSLTNNITRLQGIGLLATTLLGTGIFILPQITVEIAGIDAILSWSLLTLIILPIVLIFSKLSSLHSHAAGPAYFIEQAFGKITGRMIGCLFVLAVPVGAAAALMMAMTFISGLISLSDELELAIYFLMLATLWLLNIKDVQLSAKIQLGLTITVTAIVLLMLIFFMIDPTPVIKPAEPARSFDPILTAAGIAFWSFLGIEALSHFSSEFKNPKRDFVPAMIIGTSMVGFLYLACVWLVADYQKEGQLSMVVAFDSLFGFGGRWVIGVLGVISALATINVYIGSVARLCWSLSNDEVLPKFCAQLNKHQVPQKSATMIISSIALVVIAQYIYHMEFEIFINLTNGIFVLIYGVSMASALKLLAKKYHFLAVTSILCCGLVAIILGWNMLYAIVLALITSLFLYGQTRYQHKR